MAKEYKTEKYKLTDGELKNVEIVLSDALPYELAMLEAAARYMEDEAFAKLPVDTDCIAGLTRNAIIECFWTHARCLIEFFNRTENNNKYTASVASVKDLTNADYWPSGDIEKLSEKHKEGGATPICTQINEQISHVGFCRKTEQWNKFRVSTSPSVPRVDPLIFQQSEVLVVGHDRPIAKLFATLGNRVL